MFWVVWVRMCEFSCLSVNPCDSDIQEVDTDSLRPPDTPKLPPDAEPADPEALSQQLPLLTDCRLWRQRELKAPGQHWLIRSFLFFSPKKRERKKTVFELLMLLCSDTVSLDMKVQNKQTGTVLNPSVLFKWDSTICIIPTCVFDSQSFSCSWSFHLDVQVSCSCTSLAFQLRDGKGSERHQLEPPGTTAGHGRQIPPRLSCHS